MKVLLTALALVASLAPAQTIAPSGTYGFLIKANQLDSAGDNGGALIGILTLDSAGNVKGTYTSQGRDPFDASSASESGTFTGKYTGNPDGSGTFAIEFDEGFTLTLAAVPTDGGQGLELISPVDGLGNFVLRGTAQTLTGNLATGFGNSNIAVTLSGVTAPGTTVFTAAPATTSGRTTCPNGAMGDWTLSIPSLTVITNGGANVAGNYLMGQFRTVCGEPEFETLSGLVTGSFGPGGALVLTLRNPGFSVSGSARTARGGSLNGSYGFQFEFAPYPSGTIGTMKFDSEGNVTASFINSQLREFGTGTRTGKYSLNADGTGKISLNTPAGQPGGPTYAIVLVDGGTGFYLLQTGANPQGSVVFGTARQQ